jgi:hypothetical protein
MAFSGVDKFPLVAKILVDMRLQELVKENRKLKEENQKLELLLFWQKYGCDELRDSLSMAVGYCRDRFDRLARKHGFTFVGVDGNIFTPFENESLDEDEEGNEDLQIFCPGDIYVMPSRPTEWIKIKFGEKLNQAKSIHDPELVKLKKFFEKLRV